MKTRKTLTTTQIMTVIFCYTFAFWFSKELVRPAISISLSDSDSSSVIVGMLLSLQNFLPLILCIPMSSWGDRYGHEKVLNLGSAFTVISGIFFLLSLMCGGSAMIWLITVGQIFSGIAWTVSWISLQALTSGCDEKNKDAGKSANGVNRLILIMSFGMVLGPALSGVLIDTVGITSVWTINMLFCIVQMVFSMMLRGSVQTEDKRQKAVRLQETGNGIVKQLGGLIYFTMVTFSFIMMFGSEIRSSYMSVLLRDASVASNTIGVISSLGALATCLIRVVMNLKCMEKIPKTLLIVISMSFSVAAFVTLAFLPVGNMYAIPSILIGLCGGMVEPVLIMIILDNADRNRKGLALTGRVLVNRLAMFVAPLIASLLVTALGIAKGFGTIASVLLVLIIVTLSGMKIDSRRKRYEES